jgi:hypothetical protein
MQEEGLEGTLDATQLEPMEQLPRMTNLSIVSLIISSSPWLRKISTIVEFLKDIQDYEESDILEKIQAFEDPSFLNALQNFDFSQDFMSGSQGQTFRQLYELVAEIVLKKGISEAVSILETIFGDLWNSNSSILGQVLINVLNGGLPFHDFDFEELVGQDWVDLYGGNKLSNFKVLDYMQTKNYREMAESGLNANGPMGNHNWLLWQQSLYLSMKNAKTPSERQLFGVLCNDLTSQNLDHTLTFEESLYSLFRSYLNNEVMRRYIVVRKLLQKHGKIVLFNEPCNVEQNFNDLNPSEILNYIYPGSSTHSSFINKKSFIEKLNNVVQETEAYSKNLHFSIIFDYLDPNGTNNTNNTGSQNGHFNIAPLISVTPASQLAQNYKLWQETLIE